MRATIFILLSLSLRAADCSSNVAEQQRILGAITNNARQYTNSLPDFLATRVVTRWVDPTGTAQRWRKVDTIEQQLAYYQHVETYRETRVNGQPVKSAPSPGLNSGGEFGAVFEDIFDEKSLADFKWRSCSSIRGVPVYIFDYHETKVLEKLDVERPDRSNSFAGGSSRNVRAEVPYHGRIYADRHDKKVMRITVIAEVSHGFPMRNLEREIDYGWTLVGGGQYVLPQKAEIRGRIDGALMRNEMEFVLYRKFDSDSVLKFGK
ncbi:MAG TPA: hypothetical protein VMB85_27520 [Bryobacteraceae bacterium]|nr:hypothetical protein [Bryobacteraceae bacterium]